MKTGNKNSNFILKNIIKKSQNENRPRKDWPEAFQKMAKNGDDQLIIPDVFEDEDFKDWTWK